METHRKEQPYRSGISLSDLGITDSGNHQNRKLLKRMYMGHGKIMKKKMIKQKEIIKRNKLRTCLCRSLLVIDFKTALSKEPSPSKKSYQIKVSAYREGIFILPSCFVNVYGSTCVNDRFALVFSLLLIF